MIPYSVTTVPNVAREQRRVLWLIRAVKIDFEVILLRNIWRYTVWLLLFCVEFRGLEDFFKLHSTAQTILSAGDSYSIGKGIPLFWHSRLRIFYHRIHYEPHAFSLDHVHRIHAAILQSQQISPIFQILYN
jgi:hypothetical protein